MDADVKIQIRGQLIVALVDRRHAGVRSSSIRQSGDHLATNQLTNQPAYRLRTTTTTDCAASNGFISFELMTDYVLSAPADSMLVQPGTLQLTDCLNMCRLNSSCLAINFETGLCVLLQESADKNPQALQRSSFPVFTIYAHKICLQGESIRSDFCSLLEGRPSQKCAERAAVVSLARTKGSATRNKERLAAFNQRILACRLGRRKD